MHYRVEVSQQPERLRDSYYPKDVDLETEAKWGYEVTKGISGKEVVETQV